MEQQKQSFFKKFKQSIISPGEIPIMAKEGIGRAILYLLLLTLTLGVISGTIHSVKAYMSFSNMIESLRADIPMFSLANGELNVEGDEPIILADLDGAVIIIDDSGMYTRENVSDYPGQYNTIILIAKESLIIEDGIETTEVIYSDFGDVALDRDMLLSFLPFLSGLIFLLGIGIVIWFFISKLAMGLLYALFGFFASRLLKKKYSYGSLYSMGLYAITVPTIIGILLSLANINLSWIIYAGIVVIIYVLAFRQARTDDEPKEEPFPLDEEIVK